jgi:flagellar hook assembly protein FlgD
LVHDNAIFDNAAFDFYASTTTGGASSDTLDAEDNWWGTTDSVAIVQSIYDHHDHPSSPYVDFTPRASSTSQLIVYAVSETPSLFSPNGDTLLDTTLVTASIAQSADWTLRILDSSQNVIRAYAGSGSAASQGWDGKNESASVASDGTYTYEFEASAGGETYTSAPGDVTVDNTAPTVSITSPSVDDTVGATVSIVGTTDDLHFASYEVLVGDGASPSSWTLLSQSTLSVTSDELATWNTYESANGTHVIKLRSVDDADNADSVEVTVVVDNVAITDVSASPEFFRPTEGVSGETSTISYTLDRPADVTITVYSIDFNPEPNPEFFWTLGVIPVPVDTPVVSAAKSSGANTYVWDGYANGGLLPFAAYVYTIDAVAGSRTGQYAPEYVPGYVNFVDSLVTTSFDPFQNEVCEVSYGLVAPAWVQLSIQKQADPSVDLRNLVVFEPRPTSGNVEVWDGRYDDNSMTSSANYAVLAFSQILPDNVIVTVRTTMAADSVVCTPYLIRPLYDEITTILYAITADATISLKIYDPNDILFRTLVDTVTKTEGAHSIEWNGTSDDDKYPHLQGNYRVELTLTGPDGVPVVRNANVVIYD